MRFEVVIPTYKRIGKLTRCLNSIPKQDNIRKFVYCDNVDVETARKAPLDEFTYITLMSYQYRAFGIWNHHAELKFKADIMVYLCDDTELYPDTLKNVEKHFLEKFPDTDGVVTFNQENLPSGSDSAMGCIGRKFLERYPNRQAFCPNYKSFFADTELGDYAKKLGKFHYGEDCRIIHYHPSVYKNADEAHEAIRGKEQKIDVEVNKERKEKGLLWGDSFELIDRNKVSV